jgi:hypothetical protein
MPEAGVATINRVSSGEEVEKLWLSREEKRFLALGLINN